MSEKDESTEEQSQVVNDYSAEAQVLADTIAAMQRLTPEARLRLLKTVATFFDLSPKEGGLTSSEVGTAARPTFSEDRTISPKEFLLQKRPTTDVERIACLAYYLTHYRNTQFFKTLDLSKLNTEAAQIKFSNATVAVDNATKAGFLASATRGNKQLSAIGELYVQGLPDKEAARQAISHARPRRRARRERNENSEGS